MFLCMLAYYVEWHLRQRLGPISFDATDKGAVDALRRSMVAQPQRSPTAVSKRTMKVTPDGLPVHSFNSLLPDLATLTRNKVITAITPTYPLTVLAKPTAIPQRTFYLLGVTK